MSGFIGFVMAVAIVGFSFWRSNKHPHFYKSVANATPRHYAIAGGIIFAGFLLLELSRASGASDRQAFVEKLFLLPDDIDVVSFEYIQGNNRVGRGIATATYRFTDEQLRAYSAKLDDRAYWRAIPHEKADGTIVGGVYTSEARRWQEFPKPLYSADMQGRTFLDLPWIYSMWWEQDWENIKNGRIMCYLINEVDPKSVPGVKPNDPYLVSACSEIAKSTRRQSYVFAILDFDRKTLSVRL